MGWHGALLWLLGPALHYLASTYPALPCPGLPCNTLPCPVNLKSLWATVLHFKALHWFLNCYWHSICGTFTFCQHSELSYQFHAYISVDCIRTHENLSGTSTLPDPTCFWCLRIWCYTVSAKDHLRVRDAMRCDFSLICLRVTLNSSPLLSYNSFQFLPSFLPRPGL